MILLFLVRSITDLQVDKHTLLVTQDDEKKYPNILIHLCEKLALQRQLQPTPQHDVLIDNIMAFPFSDSIPVQIALLSVSSEHLRPYHVKQIVFDELTTPKGLLHVIGSRALAKVLAKLPLETFLTNALQTIQHLNIHHILAKATKVYDIAREHKNLQVHIVDLIDNTFQLSSCFDLPGAGSQNPRVH